MNDTFKKTSPACKHRNEKKIQAEDANGACFYEIYKLMQCMSLVDIAQT